MTFWMTPDQKQILNASSLNGIVSTNGLISNLVKRSVGNGGADIQAGTGIIRVSTSNPLASKPKTISWNTQSISAAGLTGNYAVCIDQNGVGQFVLNGGASNISPTQFVNYIQLGVAQISAGIITASISIGPINSNELGNTFYTSMIVDGVRNFVGTSGFIVSAGTTNLQINISAGQAFSPLGGTLLNPATPALVERPARTPATIVALVNPITGGFSFSGTATINPTLNAHRGKITSAVSVGGTSTKFDSLAHGMQIGDTVSLATTLYNGNFVITAKTTNDFTVLTPFLGITTGTWNGLTATLLNQFTVQRCYVFPLSGIFGITYGLKEYASITTALTDYIAEDYVEPAIGSTACNAGIIVLRNNATWADTASFYFKLTQRIK